MHRLATLASIVVLLGMLAVLGNSISRAETAAMPLQVPTPGPGAMTIYSITNPNGVSITVNHIITDALSFRTEFTSTIGAGGTSEYHVRDMSNVPNPFQGAMTLQSDSTFASSIVGYDYPSTPPVVPAPTATPVIPGAHSGPFTNYLPLINRTFAR